MHCTYLARPEPRSARKLALLGLLLQRMGDERSRVAVERRVWLCGRGHGHRVRHRPGRRRCCRKAEDVDLLEQ